MAAASAGIGGLAGAGIGSLSGAQMGVGAVNAGRALGSGGNPLSAIASMLARALGVDPSILQGIKGGMTLAQLARQRGEDKP
jgi:hypothetical protein